MALWGKADDIYSPGTVYVDYNTGIITGSATSFTSASAGDVISIGLGVTFGEAVIESIVSDTEISIASTQFLSGSEISNVEYRISQKPKYTMHDSHYEANEIYGVDSNEVELSLNTQYQIGHGGWVGIVTYMDNSQDPPVMRVKSEVLVAMSGISTGTAVYVQAETATQEEIIDSAGDSEDDDTMFNVL